MKLVNKMIVLLLSVILFTNVYAKCANLKDIKIDGVPIGKNSIANTDGTKFRITIKANTTTVKIDAETDYAFVEGYGPRTVSTNEEVQIRVNGAPECGITRYYFNFVKEESTTTTQKTTTASDTNPTTSSTTSSTTTTTTTTKKVEQTEEEPTLESPVRLKSLSVDNYPIDFDAETTKYIIEVPDDVVAIKINAEKENETDTIVISENSNNLIEGVNLVTVIVTNEEGNSVTYELTVIKASLASDNNFLSQLNIEGYSVPFDSATNRYDLTIKSESSLIINAIPQDSNASIEIEGNNNLKDGSAIIINVIAENGSAREYIINIHKKESDIMAIIEDYWQFILIGAVGIIILIVLIILLINGKKKKKREETLGPDTIDNNQLYQTVSNTVDASPNQYQFPLDNQNTVTNPIPQKSPDTVEENKPVEELEIVTPSLITEEKPDDLSKTEVFKL